MSPISTYVFFDLGTTGLRDAAPKITEIHMIAIKSKDLKKYFRQGGEENLAIPPAQRELHCRLEDDEMFLISGEGEEEYCNLEDETVTFLENLDKPVCLIAHNGNKFDFPLLIAELKDSEYFSPEDFVCADSMAAFYDILEPNAAKTSSKERNRGSFPWPDYCNTMSYRLQDVFRRVCNAKTVLCNAKDRNSALTYMALTEGFEFMLWVAENNHPFTSFLV